MTVQTGRRRASKVLTGMLSRDFVHRQLAATSENLLGCGTLDHDAERMERVAFCFEESASVVLLLRGGGWYREGDSVAHRLAPGDVFVRLPGRFHETIPDDDGRWFEFFLHVPKSTWVAAEFAGVMNGVGVIWHPGLHDDILLRLAEVRTRMRDPVHYSTLDVIAAMLAIISALRARHDVHAGGDHVQPLAQAELILRSNLNQVVPVRAVASQLGMEWETFRKQFRERTNQSPAAYRNQIRLRHAQHLLVEQGMTVSDVACLVGYADAFAFSKAFRRWSGKAPSSYSSRQLP